MADKEITPKTAPAEKTPAADAAPNEIDAAVMKLGKEVYDKPGSCTACHQPTGAGIRHTFPPLAKSEWVHGPIENLIRIQLRGLQGEIEVNGQTFNGVMTPQLTQTDEQIAAVLTYVRNSFGNKASAVTPDMVAALRDEVGKPMLTVADLKPPKEEKKEMSLAVTDHLPGVENYNSFNLPQMSFILVFGLILAGAAAKLVFSKS